MSGIGAFFSGAIDGYDKGLDQSRKAKEEQRRQTEFGLKKQALELELAAKKREEEFQADLKSSMAPIMQELTAARNPPPEQNGLQGVQPAPQPLDLTNLSRRFADNSIAVGFRHGKLSIDQLKQARDLRTQMDKENVDEAVQTWLTTGDRNKVAEVFNKGGKFKFDPNTMDIRTVQDPDGLLPANVVVVAKNPDGTERQVFNYEQMAMAGISKDTYAQLVQGAKTTRIKEKGDTFRTGMTVQGSIAAASAKADKDLPPEVKAFNDRMNKEFEAIFKGTGFNLNPREEMVLRGEISSLGRQLIDSGKTANEAYKLATQAVLQKNKIPVDLSKIK
jgi:hypothetical protein